MEKLILALQIFLKYGNEEFPTHCEHDVLRVYGYDCEKISTSDIVSLKEYGFDWDDEFECFYSYKYGSR
jgi:hypothetical protein